MSRDTDLVGRGLERKDGPPRDRILARLPAQRDDFHDIAEEYAIVAIDIPPGIMLWGRVENRWFANPSAREVVRQLLGRARPEPPECLERVALTTEVTVENLLPAWQMDWPAGVALYMQALRRAGLPAPEFRYEEIPRPAPGEPDKDRVLLRLTLVQGAAASAFSDWWGANAAEIMAELRPQGVDVGDAEDIARAVYCRLFPLAAVSRATEAGAEWPPGVSDGLSLPCHDCGQIPRFDYVVADEFWNRWVGGAERMGVICLPCLDRRCHGEGLAEALQQVQWTGTGHTVVLKPVFRHGYEPRTNSGERPTVAESFQELLARVTLTPEEEQAVRVARISASNEVETLLAIIDRMTGQKRVITMGEIAENGNPDPETLSQIAHWRSTSKEGHFAAGIYRPDGEADER